MSGSPTYPVAERPADAVEAAGPRADDRHMGILDRHGEDLFVGVRFEGF
jgi:hypothetical protein